MRMSGSKIRSGTGLIHLYSGNGKGKTTAAMGLCVRAAGSGYRVLIYQFMKNNAANERKAMEQIPGITFLDGLEQEKFSFQMTDSEKRSRKEFYADQLEKAFCIAWEEEYDVLFLDEEHRTLNKGKCLSSSRSGNNEQWAVSCGDGFLLRLVSCPEIEIREVLRRRLFLFGL